MTTSISEFFAQYDNANSTTFNTPSMNGSANVLYVIFIHVGYSSANPRTLSSVTGGGLGTWNIIAGASIETSTQTRRAEAAWAWSNAPTGIASVSITFSGATTGCAYMCYAIRGFNPVTPIGDAGTTRGTNTTATPTATPVSTDSGLIASLQQITQEAVSAEGTWTAGTSITGANHAIGARAAHRTNPSDTGCQFTWTTSGSFVANIVEILPAGGLTVRPSRRFNNLLVR